MVEFLIVNFYSIAGAVLLTCFVGYLNWRNNFKVRKANAAAAFRAATDNVLSALRYRHNEDAADILIEAFPAHDTAVNEFSRFLGLESKAFLSAWDQYARHEILKTGHFLQQYSAAGCSIHERERRRKLAIDRIERVRSYAKDV